MVKADHCSCQVYLQNRMAPDFFYFFSLAEGFTALLHDLWSAHFFSRLHLIFSSSARFRTAKWNVHLNTLVNYILMLQIFIIHLKRSFFYIYIYYFFCLVQYVCILLTLKCRCFILGQYSKIFLGKAGYCAPAPTTRTHPLSAYTSVPPPHPPNPLPPKHLYCQA